MGDKKHTLEEPAASYGRKVKIRDLEFEPLLHLEQSLREQGYISFDELKERLAKYL